jgi:NADH:ubiquinone oxidoreductase subunit 4 (subunit M)
MALHRTLKHIIINFSGLAGIYSLLIIMLLLLLLIIPLIGIFIISTSDDSRNEVHVKRIKFIALATSVFNLLISLVIFILFDFSNNQFQFVQEYHQISSFDLYLGIDGLSIYFVILTTIIIPISLLSN